MKKITIFTDDKYADAITFTLAGIIRPPSYGVNITCNAFNLEEGDTFVVDSKGNVKQICTEGDIING